jgi:hypothetical protein
MNHGADALAMKMTMTADAGAVRPVIATTIGADTAAGSAIPKVTPKHRAVVGTIPITGRAAGTETREVMQKPRAAAGIIRITDRAAGMAIQKAIRKHPVAVGTDAATTMTMTIAAECHVGAINVTNVTR